MSFSSKKCSRYMYNIYKKIYSNLKKWLSSQSMAPEFTGYKDESENSKLQNLEKEGFHFLIYIWKKKSNFFNKKRVFDKNVIVTLCYKLNFIFFLLKTNLYRQRSQNARMWMDNIMKGCILSWLNLPDVK